MQMWSGGKDLHELDSEAHMDTYAKSIADFLAHWQNKKDGDVSLRIDGYDIDYESGNRTSNLLKIVNKIRDQVGGLKASPNFTISMSIDNLDFISSDLANKLDTIALQNYQGGDNTTLDEYIGRLGKDNIHKVFYGILAEAPTDNSTDLNLTAPDRESEHGSYHDNEEKGPALVAGPKMVVDKSLAGIMMWRLNSDNMYYENAVQVLLWNTMHPDKPQLTYSKDGSITKEQIIEGWSHNGGRCAAQRPRWNRFY